MSIAPRSSISSKIFFPICVCLCPVSSGFGVRQVFVQVAYRGDAIASEKCEVFQVPRGDVSRAYYGYVDGSLPIHNLFSSE